MTDTDPRFSPSCRKALAILTEGPCYLTGAGRYFGSRRGMPLAEMPVKQRVIKPLFHVDVAGQLTRAGMARIVRTGRPDRPGNYMLVLTPFGRAIALSLQVRRQWRAEAAIKPDASSNAASRNRKAAIQPSTAHHGEIE